MKKLYFLFLLTFGLQLSTSKCNAQYVTISDPDMVLWFESNGCGGCLNGNQLDTNCAALSNLKFIFMENVSMKQIQGLEYFKNATDMDCLNNDSLISISGFPPNLTTLQCIENPNLASMPAFPSPLKHIECGQNPLVPSILNLPAGLDYFDCNSDYLITSLPPLPDSLTYLNCSSGTINQHSQLASLPSLPAHLQTLECFGTNITALPPLPPALTTLDCSETRIKSIPALPNGLLELTFEYDSISAYPVYPSSLNTLDCSYTPFISPTSFPSTLRHLFCDGLRLKSLPALPPNLIELFCAYNSLGNLPSVLPAKLQRLGCYGDSLTSLPTLPDSLQFLECPDNYLFSLPPLPKILVSLYAYDNRLTSLPALPDTMLYLEVNNNYSLYCLPRLTYIQTLDIDYTGITCLPNYPAPYYNTYGLPLCDVFNQYGCQPYWNISGTAYADVNDNCIHDAGEPTIPRTKIELYQGANLIQQGYFTDGLYSFKTGYGTYTVKLDTTGLPFTTSCPSTADTAVTLSPADSLLYNINFGLRCKPGFDIGVWSINESGRFFPGRTAHVFFNAGDVIKGMYGATCNAGSLNGKIKLVFNGPITYVSADSGSLAPNSAAGDSLVWNVTDFSLLNTDNFSFSVQTNPSAQLSAPVCFTVYVTPTSGDNNLSNNTLTQCFSVVNSLDPNYKEVSPPADLPYPYNDWLTYTIHFQNTGTAPAQHIQVLDTLDANLDPQTFQLLAYSFPPTIQISSSYVSFDFVNINLPDSTANPKGSQGYVQYRIKPVAGITQQQSVSNSASIYFDLNNPVRTNTTTSAFIATNSGKQLKNENVQFSVYPNPTTGIINVVWGQQCNGCQLIITDVVGRVVELNVLSGKQTTVDMSSLSSGVYFIRVSTAVETQTVKVVKE